jgi:hypothetical protein
MMIRRLAFKAAVTWGCAALVLAAARRAASAPAAKSGDSFDRAVEEALRAQVKQ